MLAKKTILFALSLVVAGSVARAESDVETTVEYRHGVMTSLKGHIGASARIVLEGYVAPEGHLAAHAAAMAAVTNDIPAMFPEGSTNEESEALPAVWEQWDKFREAARDNHAAALAFAEAVSGGAGPEQLAESFEALLDTCRGCHDDFREEHD